MGPLLGVLFAAVFALIGINTLTGIQQRGVENQRASVAADQLKLIATAAQTYVQANAAQIETMTAPSTAVTITVPMLQAAAGLSTGVSAVNPYGQTWVVQVLQPQAGVLQALVLSQGGSAIPTLMAPSIAAMAGGSGGFVPAAGQYGTLNSNVAEGAYGGWQVSLAGYANPGPGHLAGLVQFSNGNLPTNDYLYRVAVPGQPTLNTMQTTLNMGGNPIANAGTVNATNAVFPGGDGQHGVQIGSSIYYGDSQNSAVFQNGGLYVENYAGGYAPLYAQAIRAVNAPVIADTQFQPGMNGSAGGGCSPNGALTASTDGSGTLLSCVNGVWTTPAPLITPVTFVAPGPAVEIVGNYHYCAFAGGDPPTSITPYQDNGDGTYQWELWSDTGTEYRVNCF